MSKHAEIRVAGYTVPLIGLQPDATENRCDECGGKRLIQDLKWTQINKRTLLLCAGCSNKFSHGVVEGT